MYIHLKTGKSSKSVKRILTKTNILLAVLVILVALPACSIMPKEEQTLAPPLVKPPKPTYTYVAVKKGSCVREVTGSGSFVSQKEVALSFNNIDGKLKNYYVKMGDTVKKGQVLADLETGDLSYNLKKAEYNVEMAQVNLAQAIAKKADKYELKKQQISLDEAELDYDQLKQTNDSSKIVSPMNGVITLINENVQPGDDVPKNQPLIKVSDPNEIQLFYQAMDLGDFQYVKAGMKAAVTVDGKSYTGTVVVSPSETSNSDNDETRNSMLLKVDKLPSTIKMGHLADFQIVLQKKDNVLLLPIAAVNTTTGRTYVQIMDGDKKREVDVQTGIKTATNYEIVSGLKEGQQVILR